MNKPAVANIQAGVGNGRFVGGKKNDVAWPQISDIHLRTDGCLLVGCTRQVFAEVTEQKQRIAGAVKSGWSGTAIAVRCAQILFGKCDNVACRRLFSVQHEEAKQYGHSNEYDAISTSGYKAKSKSKSHDCSSPRNHFSVHSHMYSAGRLFITLCQMQNEGRRYFSAAFILEFISDSTAE